VRALVLLVAATSTAVAAPPPKECGASIAIPKGGPQQMQIAGTVKSISAAKGEPSRFEIAVTTTSGDKTFELYIAPARPPFSVGDKIDASLRRGGGWHQVYDALIKDGAGKVLLIISGSGADDLADGWKVTMGAVQAQRQDPNQKQQSINRTHSLVFKRAKTTAIVPPNKCAAVKDGADSFIVSGFGNTWQGIRPPEGIDYQTFAMIRW
jgi:hypothetical protein